MLINVCTFIDWFSRCECDCSMYMYMYTCVKVDRCLDELIDSFLSLKITLACFFPVYNCIDELASF